MLIFLGYSHSTAMKGVANSRGVTPGKGRARGRGRNQKPSEPGTPDSHRKVCCFCQLSLTMATVLVA